MSVVPVVIAAMFALRKLSVAAPGAPREVSAAH
jgi:hypothetical protein